MRCEDYPCCGHTNDDPCGPQWYDAPDAFDTTKNPHALCDHETGECDVWEDEEDDEECEHDGAEYSHAGWVCSWCGVGVPDPEGWDAVNGRWAD